MRRESLKDLLPELETNIPDVTLQIKIIEEPIYRDEESYLMEARFLYKGDLINDIRYPPVRNKKIREFNFPVYRHRFSLSRTMLFNLTSENDWFFHHIVKGISEIKHWAKEVERDFLFDKEIVTKLGGLLGSV